MTVRTINGMEHARDIIFIDVEVERHRQDAKWGPQHWPSGTHQRFVTQANRYRDECEDAAKSGSVTWRHILLEELFEALAETDPKELRKELIQAIAVAVAWVEDIDRGPVAVNTGFLPCDDCDHPPVCENLGECNLLRPVPETRQP